MKAAVRPQNHKPGVNLSPREREVLAELARGATTAEIASGLVISSSTVKTHVSHILEKLGAANRAEAVGRAAALGLLDPQT
jgi:DNA-binding NarL/FixJ family response regulator